MVRINELVTIMKGIYKFLPFEKIDLETDLSIDEIIYRLSKYIETDPSQYQKHWLTYKAKSTKEYEGDLNHYGFNINKLVESRNSFLPDIKGEFIEGFDSRIKIKITLTISIPVLVIVSFMILVLLIVNLALIPTMIREFEPAMLILPGMLLFLYAFVIGIFKMESVESRKFLIKLLKAKEK